MIEALRPHDIIAPGKPERFASVVKLGRRYNNASDIKIPTMAELKFCKWCVGQEITGRRHYCSELCQKSCYAYLKPQSDVGKVHLLLRQNLKCVACDYSWAFVFQEYINEQMDSGEPLSFYRLGAKIWGFSGQEPGAMRGLHVDHIIPISQGGDTFGFDNCQGLCEPCHWKKTADERRKGEV